MEGCRWVILLSFMMIASMWQWGQALFPAKGDLNNDGVVNAADTVLLANYQAGNIGELQAGGDLYAVDGFLGVLRYVPAGTFTQGSPSSEPCQDPDETQFYHTLTHDIAVMETEVTRQMWANLRMLDQSLPDDPTNPTYGASLYNPVQNVSWNEAVLFANLLSMQWGLEACYYKNALYTEPVLPSNYTSGSFYWKPDALGYRLLSEGEWEYACRAGTSTPFWINEPNYNSGTCGYESCTPYTLLSLEMAAWFCANQSNPSGYYTSKPVGMKVHNPWGLHDTHGNVWEWCWDWYGTYPSGSAMDYKGPSSGSYRVIRGGSWDGSAAYSRSAMREYTWDRGVLLGFRLARSLP